MSGRIVASVSELRAFPIATVVETAGGIRYVKAINGRWVGPASKRGAASAWLLDPDHSRPPVRVLYLPGGAP